MRRPLLALALAAVAGYLVVAVVGARDDRRLAASAAVPSNRSSGVIPPGARLCEPPVAVPFAANAVQMIVVTGGAPAPPLTVSVRSAASGRTLAQGRLPGGYRMRGYPQRRVRTVELPPIPAREAVSVCIRNSGTTLAALYAGRGQKARRDHGVSLVALRPPRSALSAVPDIFRRAALFKGSWVGAWLFWLLAAAVGIAVPVLLGASLTAAARTASAGEPREQVRNQPERRPSAVVPAQQSLGVEGLPGSEPVGADEEVAQQPDGDAAQRP